MAAAWGICRAMTSSTMQAGASTVASGGKIMRLMLFGWCVSVYCVVGLSSRYSIRSSPALISSCLQTLTRLMTLPSMSMDVT